MFYIPIILRLLNCPAETIHVTRWPQIPREPHAGQSWPKQCQMDMRSEHGMLRASICHVHRTELANYRRSEGTQAVLNQKRTLSHVENGIKIVNYRRDPLYVTEMHKRLNEWSLLETGYLTKW
jgi:hypothetical protein